VTEAKNSNILKLEFESYKSKRPTKPKKENKIRIKK
jgi:hypothetical protein